MNTLEKKVNALMCLVVSEDGPSYDAAKAQIKQLMETEKSCEMGDAETLVNKMLVELGMPQHISGYDYVLEAICLVAGDRTYLNQITDRLYPDVARKFSSNKSRVERAIRHGIECAWNRADLDAIQRYFGNTVSAEKGKPTNGEFIAMLGNLVRRQLRQAA